MGANGNIKKTILYIASWIGYICVVIAVITSFVYLVQHLQATEVKADIPWTATLVIKSEGCWTRCMRDDVYVINGPEGKFLYIDGTKSIGLVQIK